MPWSEILRLSIKYFMPSERADCSSIIKAPMLGTNHKDRIRGHAQKDVHTLGEGRG